MDVHASLAVLNTVKRLADTGRHAALAAYVESLSPDALAQSPTIALLFGIAQARLGRHDAGERWVEAALDRARRRGDPSVRARALNVSGAIAFHQGRIAEAARRWTEALAEAEREGDRATVGRCSNNLGIIANLRGQHGRAIGSYTMAIAAFQQAGLRAGVAEALHNQAITYRDQGELRVAIEMANRAVSEATVASDLALAAQALGGRAEIRLYAGDFAVARREIEQALARHRDVGNFMGETEDLRVLGCVLAAQEEADEGAALLRTVIERAEQHGRPLLVAQAERDLARLMVKAGRGSEALELARRARVRFQQLGAEVEVYHMDELLHAAEV